MATATYKARDTYNYGVRWFVRDFTTPAANPSLQVVKIDNDSDFAIQKICYSYSYDATESTDDNRPIGGFEVKIFDSTTGRYWSNDFVAIDTVAGFGALPFVLPTPKVMVANSQINILLRADTAPTLADSPAFVFVLNFIGDKLFR